MNERRVFSVIAAVFIFAGFMYVSESDYRHEKERQAYQCEMIEQGHWPKEVNPNCEVVLWHNMNCKYKNTAAWLNHKASRFCR